MQGVSFGGESSGAIVLIVESTSKHRGFVCGLIMLFISGGVLFANLLYSFISYLFTPSELIDYGWRIAYIITGLTSLITFFARKKLYDSEDFKHSKKVLNLKQSLELVIANKLSFFSAIFCKMGTGVFVGVMIGYLPNYYNTTDKLDTKHLSLFVLLITTGLIIGDIVGGIISDIFSRKSVLITSGIIMAFLSVPMFYFVFSDITIISIMFGVTIILFSLFAGMQDGVSSCFLAENSPLTVRFTFLALTSQIGIALFSGFTPLFSSLLTSYTNVVNVLGFYLAIAFAVQTLAVYLLSKSRVD
jgi:MFS family permease